jgi:hypothetical protein
MRKIFIRWVGRELNGGVKIGLLIIVEKLTSR